MRHIELSFCQFLWSSSGFHNYRVAVVQIRANTEKAAIPKDCYFALHSSIERRVRRKKPLQNTNTSVSVHIREKWFIKIMLV